MVSDGIPQGNPITPQAIFWLVDPGASHEALGDAQYLGIYLVPHCLLLISRSESDSRPPATGGRHNFPAPGPKTRADENLPSPSRVGKLFDRLSISSIIDLFSQEGESDRVEQTHSRPPVRWTKEANALQCSLKE